MLRTIKMSQFYRHACLSQCVEHVWQDQRYRKAVSWYSVNLAVSNLTLGGNTLRLAFCKRPSHLVNLDKIIGVALGLASRDHIKGITLGLTLGIVLMLLGISFCLTSNVLLKK